MYTLFVTAAKAYIARMRQDDPQKGTSDVKPPLQCTYHCIMDMSIRSSLQPACSMIMPHTTDLSNARDMLAVYNNLPGTCTEVDAEEEHAALSERLQQQALEVRYCL